MNKIFIWFGSVADMILDYCWESAKDFYDRPFLRTSALFWYWVFLTMFFYFWMMTPRYIDQIEIIHYTK